MSLYIFLENINEDPFYNFQAAYTVNFLFLMYISLTFHVVVNLEKGNLGEEEVADVTINWTTLYESGTFAVIGLVYK